MGYLDRDDSGANGCGQDDRMRVTKNMLVYGDSTLSSLSLSLSAKGLLA